MKPKLRAALAMTIGSVGLLACAQLIGLDDTQNRSAVTGTTNDAKDAGEAGPSPDPVADTGTDANGPCTSNKECTARVGSLALCVGTTQKSCVKVRDDLCYPVLFPNRIESDNLLVIPAFIPRKATLSAGTEPAALAMSLAASEFTSGIPFSPRLDVAVLLCSSDEHGADPVKHVVNDLKVPAIIAGGFLPSDLTNYVHDITSKAGVFVLNASSAPEALKYEQDLNAKLLFWSLLGTSEDVALAYRPLVAQLSTSTYVQDKLTARGAGPDVKIALVYTETPGETSGATVVELGAFGDDNKSRDIGKAIAVNGTSPIDAGSTLPLDAGSKFFYRDHFKTSEQTDNYTVPKAVADNLITYRPDIVVALTSGEIGPLAEAVDVGIFNASGNDLNSLPMWVLGQRNAHPDDFLDYLAAKDHRGPPGEPTNARRKRFLGIQYAGTPPDNREQYVAWLKRMDSVYRGSDNQARDVDYSATENYYDAVYWIAFGLFAGKTNDVNLPYGEAIGHGVRALLRGTPTKPGAPDDLYGPAGSFTLLLTAKDAGTYIGALGPPDINERFGSWNSVGGTYCYLDDTSGTSAPNRPKILYDVQRYNPADGGLADVRADGGAPYYCHLYH